MRKTKRETSTNMTTTANAIKTVIITGGANGIGKYTCKYLLEKGFKVTIADSDEQANERMESYIHENKGVHGSTIDKSSYLIVKTDVTSEQQVSDMIQQTINKFGRLDCLVNNAALSQPYNTELESMSLEEWNRVINVNLNSLFLTSKHSIPHLKETKGCIINMSSTRSIMSEPNSEAYSTTKGGVLAFTHSLANSIGPRYGIRVNAISPGWIDTTGGQDLREVDHKQHLVGRVGQPLDIAQMIEYLMAAKFVTGQNFVIDGGMTVKMIYNE